MNKIKLSPTQQKVLDKMEVNVWYNSFTLNVKITTMFALAALGLVKSKGLGFDPTIQVRWCKK